MHRTATDAGIRRQTVFLRKIPLLGLTWALTLAWAPASAQGPTAGAASPATFVIVHGAWGGSWAFKRVDALLAARSHIVYRPSLTGLGERVHLSTPDIGLATHIDDVVNMLVFENLKDVTLVGHSYGGMVITGVADRVPERIRKLIYLDAMVPVHGESVMTVWGDARSAGLRAMAKDGFVVPPWVRSDQPPPKDVPQPLKTFTEPITLTNKTARQLPAVYVLTVDKGKEAKSDDFASQAERAAKRGWPVLELAADHNPQWSAPEALVELLDKNR
jgi:pimeloyl-ACP methyl ester carboxylesterase